MQGPSSLSSVLQPILPLIYLIALGVIISLLFSIVNMFSMDRVLKLVKGRKTFVFIGKEAHYGKLHVLPRGGGGFEVFYTKEGTENPLSLVAFLMENYHETGNERFLEKAKVVLDYLKKVGLIEGELTENDIRINPWSPPSLVSRKVYSSELNDLWMIISFVDFMSEEERKRRWKELSELYSRPFIKVVKRRYGKEVTVIEGIDGSQINLEELAKFLKTKLACGGTVKNGVIELQGNHVTRVKELLIKKGFNPDQIKA